MCMRLRCWQAVHTGSTPAALCCVAQRPHAAHKPVVTHLTLLSVCVCAITAVRSALSCARCWSALCCMVCSKPTCGAGGNRDVDVLFFGLMNPRRAALLAAVNASGLAVHVLTGETMTFGGALDTILARTKIVLNLHFYDGIMVRLRVRPPLFEGHDAAIVRGRRTPQLRMMHGLALHDPAPGFQRCPPDNAQESPTGWQSILLEAMRMGSLAGELPDVMCLFSQYIHLSWLGKMPA